MPGDARVIDRLGSPSFYWQEENSVLELPTMYRAIPFFFFYFFAFPKPLVEEGKRCTQ